MTTTDVRNSFFGSIEAAPPDSILGLNEAFKNDSNPDKINLTVGVYQNEQGETPIFKCIQLAEKRLAEIEKNKSYLGISGSPEYAGAVQKLLFGEESEIIESGRAATAQSPGGTGGLRIAADFIKRRFPAAKAWFSKPTWANHPAIFAAAGMETEQYEYLDANRTGLDFDAMIQSLQKAAAGDVIVLHGCCHNPTGVDLTTDQWQQVAELVQDRNLLPLVDCAYQGFNDGLEEDTQGIRILVDAGLEVIICSSFSKNLGLYGERVGAMTLVADDKPAANAAMSHVKACIRVNYSNPPKHGAALASIVLNDPELTRYLDKKDVTLELANIRKKNPKKRPRVLLTQLTE